MTTTTIASGQTEASGYIVASGDTLDVLSGGVALDVTIASGGEADFAGTDTASVILDGGLLALTGTETNITISSGGTETVSAGTITGGEVDGFQDVLTNTTGATITGETIGNGGTLLLDNKTNTVSSTTIETGGTFAINGNATGADMVIAGGEIDLDSAKSNLAGTLSFSGTGTLVENSVISAGYGDQAVISGFGAGDVIDLTAIGSGATLSTVASGVNTVIDISGGSGEGSSVESFTFSGTGGTYALATDSAGTGEALTGSAPANTGSTTSIIDSYPTLTSFTAGDIVISVVGGVDGNGYTDNQATPVILEEIDPTTGTIVGVMELPQTASGANNAFSGEYGSSSEGLLQLAANDQSLVIAGYDVSAAAYNAGESNGNNIYGNAALAQSTSIEGGTYTAVARVIANISYNGNVDTSTALYNVFNTNNPRSVATVDGSSFYISGQGVKGDTTQGVYLVTDGSSTATEIYDATDTREVEIYNGTLYVSIDSTQNNTAGIASFGTLPTGSTTADVLTGIQTSVTLTAAEENTVNASAVGTSVALSPEQYFFANATTLYVADGGDPKGGTVGDGGLQKWTLDPKTGVWTLDYTLSAGLNLVENSAISGTTGLIGLSGVLNANGTVTFYATNSTLTDLGQTYLYTITDDVNATTLSSSESFTVVETAAADTNIRGVAVSPSAPTDTTIASGTTSSGLTLTDGSVITIASGGTLSGAVVESGATVYDLGTDTGSLLVEGGNETIAVAATASGDNVYGVQIVSGTVSGETIYYAGEIAVASGGTASDITVLADGEMQLAGTADNVALENGTIILGSTSAAVTGTLDFQGGTLALNNVPDSGAGVSALIENFNAGDVIELASFDSAATLSSTSTGGDTVETITEASLSASFTFAGDYVPGSFELATLASGGEELLLASTITGITTVGSGELAQNATIAAGGTLAVLSGGSLVNGDVLSGGVATVAGSDSGTTIQSGGTELVSAGTVSGDLVYGLQQVPSGTGALISNEIIENGGTLDIENKSNTVTSTTIETGGTFIINGNASGNGIVIAGGEIELESAKANLTDLTFSGAGTLVDTSTISAGTGGVFGIIEGFGTGDTIALTGIGTGATLASSSDGTNTTLTISGGSAEGAEADSFTFAGTYAADYFSLSNDGVLAESSTASESGLVVISSGESAPANYSIANGGTLEVQAGGSASGVTVLSGGLGQFGGTDDATLIQSGGTVELTGTETNITIASGGTETIAAGTITGGTVSGFQDVLTNTTGALITGETIGNGGTLQIDNKSNTVVSTTIEAGGTFAINGNASGNSMVIAGGLIDLQSPKSNLTDLTFSGAGTLLESALISAGIGGVFGAIEGFSSDDVIDLSAIGSGAVLASSSDGTNTTISVSGGSNEGSEVESFTFSGTGLQFALAADQAGTGEALQEVFCYLPGTMILTPSGQMPVESLKIGDALVTRFGGIRKLKWVGIQRYAGRFLGKNPDLIPVCIKAGALGEGLPLRDLYVSAGHSMLVEGKLVLAKNLVNGITVTQPEPPELVEYYSLEFETHDCVIAEGTYGESYADVPGLRNRFHNVAEFHALYPDYTAPQALCLCAPRPENGPELDEVLRPLVASAAALTNAGPLQGFVETIAPSGVIEGWAQDAANPLLPVLLDIYMGKTLLGSVLACDYRIDLQKAGIGTGHAMFRFAAPRKLSAAQRKTIMVKRRSDDTMLGRLPGVAAAEKAA